jgi:hypothetical protein
MSAASLSRRGAARLARALRRRRDDLSVARRPATRDEALELARAQHVYCNDIIDQGVGSYRALAAGLMASDWWFFWWD